MHTIVYVFGFTFDCFQETSKVKILYYLICAIFAVNTHYKIISLMTLFRSKVLVVKDFCHHLHCHLGLGKERDGRSDLLWPSAPLHILCGCVENARL